MLRPSWPWSRYWLLFSEWPDFGIKWIGIIWQGCDGHSVTSGKAVPFLSSVSSSEQEQLCPPGGNQLGFLPLTHAWHLDIGVHRGCSMMIVMAVSLMPRPCWVESRKMLKFTNYYGEAMEKQRQLPRNRKSTWFGVYDRNVSSLCCEALGWVTNLFSLFPFNIRNMIKNNSLGVWREYLMIVIIIWGVPGVSNGKESACNAGDLGSIPGLGRSPGEGNVNSLQHSCLENSMDRGAWRVPPLCLGLQRVRHD